MRHKIRAFYNLVEAEELDKGAINLFQVGRAVVRMPTAYVTVNGSHLREIFHFLGTTIICYRINIQSCIGTETGTRETDD